MIWQLVLSSAVVISSGADSSRKDTACTLELEWFVRPDQSSYVTLRATSDTALDRPYFADLNGPIATPPFAGAQPVQVYGQVFELLSASGPGSAQIKEHVRVVLIWWGLTASCGRWFPYTSRRFQGSDLFLAKTPRDRSEWIFGMPTYDLDAGDWYYSPARYKAGSMEPGAERRMSVSEYASMYPLLPTKQALADGVVPALQPLLEWGSRNPDRWRLSPARIVLCRARTFLRDYTACPRQ
jgi:hypothetical protein